MSPPRGSAVMALGEQIEQQLGLVFRHVSRRAAPDEIVLTLADEAARDLLGGAEVDHGAGRAGGAEGEAAELQARRGLLGHVADDVEGVVLGFLVVVLVEDLEPIVDGAHRPNDVMADLARDQCREFKVRRIGALAHRCPLKGCRRIKCRSRIWPPARGTPVTRANRSLAKCARHLIHAPQLPCKGRSCSLPFPPLRAAGAANRA